MRTPYNDNHDKTGIEGWYEIKSDTLVVYLEPTSGKMWPPSQDWITNYTGWIPVPLAYPDFSLGWCFAGYRKYAYWLAGMVQQIVADEQPQNVLLIGYSMGGGIAQITGLIIEHNTDTPVRVVSIDGARTTTKLPHDMELLRNRGSVVADIPPWFKKAPETILNETWRPMCVSHADYNINEIIEKEING